MREAEADVERQLRIIADLERSGHSALGAKTLLRLMEQILDGYRQALELIRAARNLKSN